MSLTLERIESLAPDQASLAAARKLLKPSSWPTLAEGNGLVWGECQGSGATPYRVVISEADAGYKCTCPSRKFPCKHSLALMWMRAEGKVAFSPAIVPDWVKDWVSRRRGSSGPTVKTEEENQAKPRPSIRIANTSEEDAAADPKAEQRSAAARDRNRQEREAAILSGLEDLDVWLADQVQHGMATFVAQAAQACRTIAQRLVDAKASGLAARLDALPTRLFTLPSAARPIVSIRELGQIHLISKAYRRADELPERLVADARQAVGWSVTREALLSDSAALRVRAQWRVIAALSEAQPDRLRRIETWLWRESSTNGAPETAVLVEFVPLATGNVTGGYLVGDLIDAELTYYISTIPLRAQISTLNGGVQHSTAPVRLPGVRLNESYETYEHALAQLPWLGTAPLTFNAARVRRQGEQLYIHDEESNLSLPLSSAQTSHAWPLTSVGAIDGIGLWNGYEFTLAWAETQFGRWTHA